MNPYTKKVSATVAAMLAAALAGAILMYNIVSASTAPDDAMALLDVKLPQLVRWLVSTPWQISALLLAALVAYAFWAFWPDRQKERAHKQSTDKAWEFSGKFAALAEAYETTIQGETVLERGITEAITKIDALHRDAKAWQQSEAKRIDKLSVQTISDNMKNIQELWLRNREHLLPSAMAPHIEQLQQQLRRTHEQFLNELDARSRGLNERITSLSESVSQLHQSLRDIEAEKPR